MGGMISGTLAKMGLGAGPSDPTNGIVRAQPSDLSAGVMPESEAPDPITIVQDRYADRKERIMQLNKTGGDLGGVWTIYYTVFPMAQIYYEITMEFQVTKYGSKDAVERDIESILGAPWDWLSNCFSRIIISMGTSTLLDQSVEEVINNARTINMIHPVNYNNYLYKKKYLQNREQGFGFNVGKQPHLFDSDPSCSLGNSVANINKHSITLRIPLQDFIPLFKSSHVLALEQNGLKIEMVSPTKANPVTYLTGSIANTNVIWNGGTPAAGVPAGEYTCRSTEFGVLSLSFKKNEMYIYPTNYDDANKLIIYGPFKAGNAFRHFEYMGSVRQKTITVPWPKVNRGANDDQWSAEPHFIQRSNEPIMLANQVMSSTYYILPFVTFEVTFKNGTPADEYKRDIRVCVPGLATYVQYKINSVSYNSRPKTPQNWVEFKQLVAQNLEEEYRGKYRTDMDSRWSFDEERCNGMFDHFNITDFESDLTTFMMSRSPLPINTRQNIAPDEIAPSPVGLVNVDLFIFPNCIEIEKWLPLNTCSSLNLNRDKLTLKPEIEIEFWNSTPYRVTYSSVGVTASTSMQTVLPAMS